MLICPAFIRTGIEKNALEGSGRQAAHPRSTIGRILEPEVVARGIVKGLQRNRRILLISSTAKAAYWLARISPRLYAWVMSRKFQSEFNTP